MFVAFLLLLCVMILEDISRLQPWVFIQTAILWTVCIPPSSKKGSRKTMTAVVIILAGTYFWSGLQKLNIAFLTEIAPWFLEGIGIDGLRPVQSELQSIANGELPSRYYGLLLMPIIEILIGLGLLMQRSRKLAAYMGIAMHVLIIAVIGPWSKEYNYIIIPWNIALAICLYIATPRVERQGLLVSEALTTRGVAFVTMMFFILPALNFFKIYDHSLSASLYSGSRSTGSYFFFKNFEADKNDAYTHVMIDHFDEQHLYLGSEVDFDKWMLRELNVPFYGEPRYIKRMGQKLCNDSAFPAGSGLIMTQRARFTSKKSVHSCYCEDLAAGTCLPPF